ncbi:MAG: 3-oxoacyl-ACP synthase [SAR324 cluster bacterium]|nr:3-oxoacyl-ACP synthase [SAR324 cluster bacterium]
MELSDYSITQYCLIRNKRIILNGKKIHEAEIHSDFPSFLSSVYKTIAVEYPKFYKMDLLSKLGILTADLLVDFGSKISEYNEDDIAIVLGNSQSSLETDARFLETIANEDNYYPNPALFVYTLPNVLIGEMCIKYKLKGESIFFVSPSINFDFLRTYSQSVLRDTKTKAIITGWIDLDIEHNYESILFLVEKTKVSANDFSPWSFTTKKMEDLYSERNLEESE